MNNSEYHDILQKLDKILEHIQKIDDKYNTQQSELSQLTNKLNNHIDFIDNTYNWLSPSLNFIKNKVDNFNSTSYIPLAYKTNYINVNSLHYVIKIMFMFLFYLIYINYGNKFNII